jgi:hypothetical protein
MNIFPKCSRCGESIRLFQGAPICDACAEKERLEQENMRKKQEEELERQRLAKADNLLSVIRNPLALLLVRHIDSRVLMNYAGPDSSDEVILRAINDAYFTVEIKKHRQIHIPWAQVLHVLEEPGAVPFISVMQLVIYKGSIGVSLPLNT